MSANKKNSNPWYQCDKCLINILHRDLVKHENDCPPNLEASTYNFISNETLFGTLNTKNNEQISGIDEKDRDNLIFLNQTAIQICKLAIGEWVIVEFEKLPPVAKIVWPTTEKAATNVLLTENSLEIAGAESNFRVKVRKCLKNLPIARRIQMVLLNKPKLFQITNDLINRISKFHCGRIYCSSNRIWVMYFGKLLKFEIKFIKSQQNTEEIEKQFQELLSIEENNFYQVNDKTIWEIFGSYTELIRANSENNHLSLIGGLDEEIREITELMDLNLNKSSTSFQISKSVLLYGHSGTGKTMLASALAKNSNSKIISINSVELYSKYNDPVEEVIKKLFDEAINQSPSVIILDEIDILCPIRSSRLSDTEKRILSTLLLMLDNLNNSNHKIFLIAITNKLDSIDSAFRRCGRFDREIEIPTPNPNARKDILKKLLKKFPQNTLNEDDLIELASKTHGYVGADLLALSTRACFISIKDKCEMGINLNHFKSAMKLIGPSAMREVQMEVPNVKWSDIGGQDNLKLILKQSIEWPLKHADSFVRLGITPPRGVLMFGPPGCSKTMIAKALATESGLNFLSIKGPELFSKWVGESEKAVRDIFKRARQVAPSIIFFDEIDALGSERSTNSTSSNVHERVLAQLLTELDGITPLGDVNILAATNRPDRIDKALLRPGRFDRIVYVPLPDQNTRREIFKLKLTKMPVTDVDIEELVTMTEGFSGAEVNAVCHEAAMKALEESLEAQFVTKEHFIQILSTMKPRTPESLLKLYNEYLKIKI